jgi:hypothetical protein
MRFMRIARSSLLMLHSSRVYGTNCTISPGSYEDVCEINPLQVFIPRPLGCASYKAS